MFWLDSQSRYFLGDTFNADFVIDSAMTTDEATGMLRLLEMLDPTANHIFLIHLKIILVLKVKENLLDLLGQK